VITASFLNEVAEFANAKVAKVVLNGAYEITTFQVKEVTDNVLALNYIVPAAEVSLITTIELKDAAGVTISHNDVYVPVTSDTLLVQTITIKEAS
jgi:hypothetical protein